MKTKMKLQWLLLDFSKNRAGQTGRATATFDTNFCALIFMHSTPGGFKP